MAVLWGEMATATRITFIVWVVGLAAVDRADRLVRRRLGRPRHRQHRLGDRAGRAWSASSRWPAPAPAGGCCFPRELRPSLRLCVLLRFVREATNALLPLAQIGGDFIGARCLALRGVRGTLAAASVIVDVLMQAATQLVFAIVGLVLLIAMGGNELVVVADRDRHRRRDPGARRLSSGAGRARPAARQEAAVAGCRRSRVARVRRHRRSVRAARCASMPTVAA